MSNRQRIATLILVPLVLASPAQADHVRTHTAPGLGTYTVPFWPEAAYRDDIQSPSDFFGFEIGARPLRYEEILRYLRYLDENFDNVSLHPYATSYEGRELVYVTVTSTLHAGRLDAIRANTASLADPRKLDGDAESVIESTPASSWMAYGIHGDELSSCDAAVQLAYQLLAGEDETTRLIRDEVVTLIDPVENPDGRVRWLAQIEQWNGAIPSTDVQSLQHGGMWPYGRGNHYLFDLNRDWFAHVHPESRGRVEAILEWNPQFLLDCHEMGHADTYLFSPPREPFNPFMISQIHKWWDKFATDQAAAFDRYGWSYYTREWNEEFFPGYGSSWGIYIGAIGMLYEQAAVDGSQIRRPDGTVMTYREAIHHQFTSSMANLATVAHNRRELLTDFHNEKKSAVGLDGGRRPKQAGAFIFPPSGNFSRRARFAETLDRQSIEVEIASEAFSTKKARSSLGGEVDELELPAGTMIVRLNQPMRALIEAILTFDIRIPSSFLETERKKRLKDNTSRLYDATGWSLPLAYNIESHYVESAPDVKTVRFSPSAKVGRVIGEMPMFGYAIDNEDDRSQVVLAELLQAGYKVWAARKPFEVEGRRFEAGSLVIRLSGNPNLDEDYLKDIALSTGVIIYGVNTALGGDLVDLGGQEFVLLTRPRVAIVGGASTSTYEFGSVWHLLDSRLGMKTSTLDIESLARMDLRKYNVIVMPSTWYDDVYKRMLGKKGIGKIDDWVKDGGTLIAMGNATAFLADSSVALTSLREKAQVLEDIAAYQDAAAWMAAAESVTVDSLDLWEAKPGKEPTLEQVEAAAKLEELKKVDELARRLRPQGVIMAAALDEEDWLCFGVRSPAPVMVSTAMAYVAKRDVRAAARFESEVKVRLSGLLWPEARRRWSGTVYAAHQRRGNGQVIVFAGQPNFRAYYYAGERLLLNALLLGPGFGTRQPIDF